MSNLRSNSDHEPIYYGVVDTKLGSIGLIGRGPKLFRLLKPAESKKSALENIKSVLLEPALEDLGAFGDLPERLQHYFEGNRTCFDNIAIDLREYRDFQVKIILAARRIPYGSVVTYSELARMAGFEKAARAAGQAMARNRTPIIVPCHRVVRADGCPGGFAWGSQWKMTLLELECSSQLQIDKQVEIRSQLDSYL